MLESQTTMRRSSTVALVCLLLLAAVLALGLLAPHLVSSPAARGRSHQDARFVCSREPALYSRWCCGSSVACSRPSAYLHYSWQSAWAVSLQLSQYSTAVGLCAHRSAASNALQIARILIALVIAGSCRTETVSNMHRHRSSLAAAMQAAQQQTSHPLDAWQAIRQQQQQQQQQYTLQDLLVVIPTTHERLSLVEAGRAWREGMQAHIVLEKPLDTQLASKGLLKGRKKYRETYGSYPDAHASHVWSQPGDARCSRYCMPAAAFQRSLCVMHSVVWPTACQTQSLSNASGCVAHDKVSLRLRQHQQRSCCYLAMM